MYITFLILAAVVAIVVAAFVTRIHQSQKTGQQLVSERITICIGILERGGRHIANFGGMIERYISPALAKSVAIGLIVACCLYGYAREFMMRTEVKFFAQLDSGEWYQYDSGYVNDGIGGTLSVYMERRTAEEAARDFENRALDGGEMDSPLPGEMSAVNTLRNHNGQEVVTLVTGRSSNGGEQFLRIVNLKNGVRPLVLNFGPLTLGSWCCLSAPPPATRYRFVLQRGGEKAVSWWIERKANVTENEELAGLYQIHRYSHLEGTFKPGPPSAPLVSFGVTGWFIPETPKLIAGFN